jgi:peptidoglycan L-alanyl-D-glutamate endopeptidase CwlK
MTDRDRQRLRGIHPDLCQKIDVIFGHLEARGHPLFVVMGIRTAIEQHKLWQQGRPSQGGAPGSKIVTYKDGYLQKSNHQPKADGFGHAVDCAFIGPDPFSVGHPWGWYGDAAKALGLVWGGDWQTLVDRPHIELP